MVAPPIATRFTMNNNDCTMPHEQELIKDCLVLRPASFRGQGKNCAEGNSGLGLYSRKYSTYTQYVQQMTQNMRTVLYIQQMNQTCTHSTYNEWIKHINRQWLLQLYTYIQCVHSVGTWKEICKLFQIYKNLNSQRNNNPKMSDHRYAFWRC